MKKLITKNLYLRPLKLSDIGPDYIKGLQDKEVTQFTEARHTKWNKQKIRQYIEESNAAGVSQLIGIFLKQSNKHIGNIRLSSFNKTHKRVDLGIMLFDKSQWGKGFATEALAEICKYIFETLGFHRICADYYSINKASARIFEKLGFCVEGVFKDHFQLNGQYVDSIRIAKLNNKK